mmetsp:Transcript_28422/g.85152  ORF Transcript_28422/g.85152 Transcript_28422/m.85152 type:complete len:207 (-) Transcript_28422:880-1500(-)
MARMRSLRSSASFCTMRVELWNNSLLALESSRAVTPCAACPGISLYFLTSGRSGRSRVNMYAAPSAGPSLHPAAISRLCSLRITLFLARRAAPLASIMSRCRSRDRCRASSSACCTSSCAALNSRPHAAMAFSSADRRVCDALYSSATWLRHGGSSKRAAGKWATAPEYVSGIRSSPTFIEARWLASVWRAASKVRMAFRVPITRS